jgi:endonuclease G
VHHPNRKNNISMRRIPLLSLLLIASLTACVDGRHAKSRDKAPAPTTSTSTPQKGDLPPTQISKEGKLLRLDYEGFTVWLDCEKRGAVKWRYNAQHDNGDEKRVDDFKRDPYVPKECQQTSDEAYGKGYDRGHQVPANHLDHSPVAIKQSNFMTNILPQTQQMNRGAWKLTEEIVECYRDIDELLVLGGVIWGNRPADDYFVKSHGVKTPDAFWKVVIRGNGDAIAWIVPNTREAVEAKLNRYLVTVAEIEKRTGEKLPVTGDARTTKPKASWVVPIGCNKN